VRGGEAVNGPFKRIDPSADITPVCQDDAIDDDGRDAMLTMTMIVLMIFLMPSLIMLARQSHSGTSCKDL
jgi:hypothetical protein